MPMVSARWRLALMLGIGGLPFAAIRRAVAADFDLRLAHTLAANDAVNTAMMALADGLKKNSNGAIEVTVFPSDQLGAQADVSEMVRQGAAVIQLTDPLFLGQYVPDVAVLQAPYIFDKAEDLRKLLGTDWIKDLETKLAGQGFRVISWPSYFGTRQMLSKRPIRNPSDLKGLNFRCGAATMYVEMIKAMGARPITTGFTEVYTGLAQGTLDLMEAPLPTIWASKFYEQAKDVCLSAHMFGWDPVVISETTWQTLPPELQKLVLSEAAKAADLMTQLKLKQEADILPQFKQAGCTIVDDVDRNAFREATGPVLDHYPGFTPGLHTTIQKLLGR